MKQEQIEDLMLASDALKEAQRLVAKANPDYKGSHQFEVLLNGLACQIVDETMKRQQKFLKEIRRIGCKQ